MGSQPKGLSAEKLEEWTREIRKFYTSHLPDLPPDYTRRYFKFVWRYPRQSAIHIRDRIKDKKHLAALAVKFAPQHIYYSLTSWLDPTTVRGRQSRAIPLWSDLVFDIDAEKTYVAKRETLQLVKYLEDMGYRQIDILFTGNKGFHVYVRDFKYEKYPEDPKERGEYFEKVKKKIIEEVISAGINVDPSLWDLYRVVRVPNTLNATTMLPAIWVPRNKLSSFSTPVIRKYPDRPAKIFAHTILISSHVIGTPDLHVLFLDYDRCDYATVMAEVERIIDKYDLSAAYIFETTKGYNVWFLDALPLKRILRIKSDTKDDPMHAAHIKLYGYDVARVWDKVYDDGRKYPAPKLIDVVLSGNTKYPISAGHSKFLSDRYLVPIPATRQVGKPTIKVIFASARA